ncbi:helix-turn-helix domain-containing protein [Apilactobacillus sp. TMW 2.2459]|uniref:helix-turn-helix domain-containing protein n=1 Tax=Apilactobacillus xinyiensis TaxID=2841032 RepID=UPI00200E440B|nr:helix-turn-helix domain-containing protein [Apilactobacillus xinyiensis]MCL0312824.1 helix-turn-helix domain-containing protein [Apilactobacillus xinyiensis]
MELAKTLKRLRIRYGSSINDFGELLGIGGFCLHLIEDGSMEPNNNVLEAYSGVLGIKVSSILLIAETKEDLKNEPFYKRWLQPLMKRIALGEKF